MSEDEKEAAAAAAADLVTLTLYLIRFTHLQLYFSGDNNADF